MRNYLLHYIDRFPLLNFLATHENLLKQTSMKEIIDTLLEVDLEFTDSTIPSKEEWDWIIVSELERW